MSSRVIKSNSPNFRSVIASDRREQSNLEIRRLLRSRCSLAMTILLCILNPNPFLFAQEPVLNQPPPAQKEDSSAQTLSPASDKLYLDFRGATLINVLFVLSQLSGINFVAGKEVAAREINMVLDGVTLDDALDAIAKGSNVIYEYIPSRNLYLFRASVDRPEDPPLVTRVFKLYYIRASELREVSGGSSSGSSSGSSELSETKPTGESTSSVTKIIKDILSARGKVNVDDRSNSVVVTDTEERVRMIEQALVELDRPVDQVLIHVYLVETFEDLNHDLGITWTEDADGAFGKVEGSTLTSSRFPFNLSTDRLLGTEIFEKTRRSLTDTATAAGNGDVDFSMLDIEFRALESASKLRILAKPKMLVLDNHPALIKITTDTAVGTEEVTTTINSQTAASSATTAERSETGTSLRVTPLINTGGRITMTLEPRFATDAAGSISGRRDTTTRIARTTMMVNDGQTIVIGGLIFSQQTTGKNKIPLLGDIPIFGEIFTARSKRFDDRELILFVTPYIIRDPSQVQAISIPDERGRFDDEVAPAWKVKRKSWFKKLTRSGRSDEEMNAAEYLAQRDQLMDASVRELEIRLKPEPAPKPVPAAASQPRTSKQ